MNKAATLAVIGVGALVAYRAFKAYSEVYGDGAVDGGDSGGSWLGSVEDVLSGTAQTIDELTGGFMNISAMARVDESLVDNTNVRAFLAVIRTGEGTTGPSGYKTLFGGGTFESLADHPKVVVKKSGYASTAAGAYQALASSWEETKRIMKLPDFGVRSQDLFALGRIVARGALADVVNGRFASAIAKVNKEWASMPGSPYGQPALTLAKAEAVFKANGGKVVA